MLKLAIKICSLSTVAATPLYLLRFKIGFLPSNALEVLILLSLSLSLLYLWQSRSWLKLKPTAADQKTLLAFVLILSGLIVSTVSAGNLPRDWGIIKGWFLLPFLFGLNVWSLRKLKLLRVHEVLFALIFGAFAVSLAALIYDRLGLVTFDNRLQAFYNSPNYLAMIVAPALAGTIAFLLSRKKRNFLLWPTMALLAWTLYRTQSVGAYLAVFLSSLLPVGKFFLRRKKRCLTVILITSVSLVLSAYLIWNLPKTQDILQGDPRSSLVSRLTIYRVAGHIGSDNPWFGIGPGQFQEKYLSYQKYYPPYLEWAVPHPHNVFLAFWLQAGLLGFSGFLFLLIIIRQTLLRSEKNANRTTISVMVLTILLHGFLDTVYWKNDLSVIFWTLIALILTLPNENVTKKSDTTFRPKH